MPNMPTRHIRKILIANRGEIALRVIRACNELGIRSVAVFSVADRRSLHVLAADEAYPLTGSSAKESYLDQAGIIEIAKSAHVDAIHPGYGFLAENPNFADSVGKAGLIFVGPPGASIRLLGNKTSARKIAKELGIPTIGGTIEPLKGADDGLQAAGRIGYPVLLKASAGGGGKGMRVVQSASEFASSFRMAQSEALSAFGDDSVFLEQYLDSPRHIEMQIVGDQQGNVLFLGERECSIQRRHQKIIEESPSPAIDEKTRNLLGQSAVSLVKAAGYFNAGTVEFLLDAAGNFYFLEMNTRLQVEHPVTEETTGIDLVKQQILVAEGNLLPLTQAQVHAQGHAIECRICAEDSGNDFFPSTGRLERYRPPEGRIRVENGFQRGDEISVYYDSLLAKVIAWRPTRGEAIAALRSALTEFAIEGVKSTIPFCQFVLGHQAFIDGRVDTRFVDKYYHPMSSDPKRTELERAGAIAAVLSVLRASSTNGKDGRGERVPSSRWKASRGDRP